MRGWWVGGGRTWEFTCSYFGKKFDWLMEPGLFLVVIVLGMIIPLFNANSSRMLIA